MAEAWVESYSTLCSVTGASIAVLPDGFPATANCYSGIWSTRYTGRGSMNELLDYVIFGMLISHSVTLGLILGRVKKQ